MNETFERVRGIVSEQFGICPEDIHPELCIRANIQADSLDAVQLAVCIEEAFNITIPGRDLANIRTIQDIVDRAILGN